jgi:hypothetical protein
MDSTKSDKPSADDDKIKSYLFNLAEKLRIELKGRRIGKGETGKAGFVHFSIVSKFVHE